MTGYPDHMEVPVLSRNNRTNPYMISECLVTDTPNLAAANRSGGLVVPPSRFILYSVLMRADQAMSTQTVVLDIAIEVLP